MPTLRASSFLGLVAALAVTACGPASVSAPTLGGHGPGGLAVATAPAGEQYLIDGAARALYLFANDGAGRSTCDGSCADAWPPFTGPATTGPGLAAALTTLARADGRTQEVYNGHPLYYFRGDSGAGDTKGEGAEAYGGHWYLLDPSGNPITSLGDGGPAPGY